MTASGGPEAISVPRARWSLRKGKGRLGWGRESDPPSQDPPPLHGRWGAPRGAQVTLAPANSPPHAPFSVPPRRAPKRSPSRAARGAEPEEAPFGLRFGQIALTWRLSSMISVGVPFGAPGRRRGRLVAGAGSRRPLVGQVSEAIAPGRRARNSRCARTSRSGCCRTSPACPPIVGEPARRPRYGTWTMLTPVII